MKTSQRAIEELKRLEGFRAFPYNDSANNCTIGFGTLLHRGPVTEEDRKRWHDGIPELQAEELLVMHVRGIEADLLTPLMVTLNQNQHDAVTILVYNIGISAFISSTLLKCLNSSDFKGAAEQFDRWNKETKGGKKVVSRGLTIRRAKERALFETPVDAQPSPPAPPVRPTLRRGDKGPAVLELTHGLMKLRLMDHPSSSFGPMTETAVKEFQHAHRLESDGICGEKTFKALDAAIANLDGEKKP